MVKKLEPEVTKVQRDSVGTAQEVSKDETFVTADEPSVFIVNTVEEVVKPPATEDLDGSMVIHTADMLSSVSGHSSMHGSKFDKNEEFMLELCGRVEKLFQEKLDCFLEETESVSVENDTKGVKGDVPVAQATGNKPPVGPGNTAPAPGAHSTPAPGTRQVPTGPVNVSTVGRPGLPKGVNMNARPPGQGNLAGPNTSYGGWSNVGPDNCYGNARPMFNIPPPPLPGSHVTPGSMNTPRTGGTIQSGTPYQHRANMSMEDEVVFQNNPAIRRLGIDAVPNDVGNFKAVDYALSQTDIPLRTGMTPVRKQAIKMKQYDGTVPWRKWFTRFSADMRHNGWEGDECLAALSWCLRDGPGDPALTSFELSGGRTYKGLVETASWALGSTSGADPASELEARVQKPGEGHRQFGMALRVLAAEAFASMSPSDPWLVRKLSSLYIDGLKDERLSSEIASQWKTTMSLADIFELTEDALRKRKLLKTVEAAPVAVIEMPVEEVELTTEGVQEVAAIDPKWKGRRSFYVRRRVPGSDAQAPEEGALKTMIGKVMEERSKAEKAEKVASRGRGKGKPNKDTKCYNCGKKGHFARTCWSKDTKNVSSVEKQKDGPSSDQSPPPTEN